jgi:cation diffusion facilitator CzcD-associated flavoprotein CzcO
MAKPSTADHRVVIVGAGFSGLGAAIKLKERGIDDFVVIERATEVGGTWEVNTYPGCRCDVPSNIYSYSFAPNPEWSQAYSPQGEIWAYLRKCAEDYGLGEHIKLGCEMVSADWDEEAALWRLESSDGPLTAKILISAVGGLVEPSLPGIPGIEDYKGAMFHSARWDHDADLEGKRVAVVGTGASAVQIVPNIAKQTAHLDVFQRTPPWIPPHPNRRTSRFERALYRRLPFTQKLVRGGLYAFFEPIAVGMTLQPRFLKGIEALCRAHLRRQVRDPELRAKLTPDYIAGCKRLTPSNAYYPTLTRDDVDLVTDPIERFTATGIRTADGTERELDAVVLATGFEVQDPPGLDRVRGRDGRSVKDIWREGGLRAHLGTTIAGFPNLFTLLGPNTGTGHQSIIYMIESQLSYVMDAIRLMDERGIAAIEVRPEAMEKFNRRLQKRSRRTVWLNGGCRSWYVDPEGRNTTIWPSFTFDFRRRTRRLDPAEYDFRPSGVPAAEPARPEPEILPA